MRQLAAQRMRPRCPSLGVEMQMAPFPKSFHSVARRTTTFSLALIRTTLSTVSSRIRDLAAVVPIASRFLHNMVLTTANGPAFGDPGVAKAA